MADSDRKIKVLEHTRGNRVLHESSGYPTKREGKNGDFRVSTTSKGVMLFHKYNNRWYGVLMEKVGG